MTAPQLDDPAPDRTGLPAELPDTHVAYIGGAGRSGSTVLALLLTELPEFVAVGGLNNVWMRGLKQNYLCGCGAHFNECNFWNEVGRQAFGGWNAVDIDEVLDLRMQVSRYRYLPWLIAPRLRPAFTKQLNRYADYMARLYRAVAKVSGRRIVVDNSHDVPPALLLQRLPHIRSKVIHLVRDSRGVAFSVSKSVLRAEATTTPTYMERYSPMSASGHWLLANVLFHAIPTNALPRLRIHYEALVASPRSELARIAEFLDADVSPSELSRFERPAIEVAENHMISGNPHRLGRRQVELRLDEEWRTAMRPGDRRQVTLLTLPLALVYGYLGGGRSRAGGNRSDVPSSA